MLLYLQRYFSKPIFRNHFTIKCENDDLNFYRLWVWVSKIENIFGEDLETPEGQVRKPGNRKNRDFRHNLPCFSAIHSSLTLNKKSGHKGPGSSPNREFPEDLCETHPFGGRQTDSLRSLPGGVYFCKPLRFSQERSWNKKSGHKGPEMRETQKWWPGRDSNPGPPP